MKIEGAAALVTGANRGLGAAIAQALVDSGAKVYGAARDSTTITNQDVIPVLLDVNSPDDIAGAARTCGDVSIVVNNAGILRPPPHSPRAASRLPEPRWRRTTSARCGWRGPSPRSSARTAAARSSTCCLSSRSSPCRKARPTAPPRRPRGRSRTRFASSSDGRALSSSPCTPASSTPTWPPV